MLLSLVMLPVTLNGGAVNNPQIRSLMQQHDPILLWAGRLMPPSQAEAAFALYAWCRRLDEIVDDASSPIPQRLVALNDWEARMDDIWSGSPRDDMDAALLSTLRSNPSLGREPFDEMVAGMRSDLAEVRYERFRPDLLQYCYRVAGTVGEMLLPVLGLVEEDEERWTLYDSNPLPIREVSGALSAGAPIRQGAGARGRLWDGRAADQHRA
jgi:phytoene/squalene synthetase